MNSFEANVIYERQNIIPINKSLSTFNEDKINEYSLNTNYFDPTNNSPPNEFMKKLKQRLSVYNTNLCPNKY